MIQFFRMFTCKAIQTADADQQQPCHIKIDWPMKYSPFAVADKRLEVNLGISEKQDKTDTCYRQDKNFCVEYYIPVNQPYAAPDKEEVSEEQ